LTLDDVDWRGRTLLIAERKNRHAIQLPLTDEGQRQPRFQQALHCL
jgi:hypothetical protein